MGTIQNTIEGLKNDGLSAIKNISSSFQDTLNSIIGTVSSTASGIYGGDVVGIDINQIGNMQNAIDEYVKEIDTHLAEVKRDADTANAYKGDFATAIRSYVDAICDACGALTSQLLQFKARLAEVQQKYTEHDEDLKAQLNQQSAEINSAFTRYTE